MIKKALVTGGAGFIGSNLVDGLIEQGIEVIVLDNLLTGKKDNINPQAIFYQVDITRGLELVDFAFEDVEVVFHLAAKTAVQESLSFPISYHAVNTTGTLNLLESCRRNKIKRFIFSSSSSVYGDAKAPTPETAELNPLSQYALNKVVGEELCKLYSRIYDLDTCILRYFNVYGNRMNNEGGYKLVFPIFKELLDSGKPLTINNDGEQRRDFIHIDDVVQSNILAATHPDRLKGEAYNIGRGKSYSINQIANMFGGEKSYENKVIEPFETLADTVKARRVLGFEPLKQLEDWIKEYK